VLVSVVEVALSLSVSGSIMVIVQRS
jgi:hypothetical protein